MILKLFQYDFRGVGKRIMPIYILSIVMSIIARFMFTQKYIFNFNEEFYDLPLWYEIVSGLIFGFAWMGIGAIFVVTFLILASQYQKTVFGDAGYLTNTLPIPVSKIILAKTFNYIVWNFIASIIAILSVAIMFINEIMINEMLMGFQYIVEYITTNMTTEILYVVFVYILIFILGLFSGPFLLFFSIGLGAQFKHKVAMSVVSYMAITTIVSTITQIIYTVVFIGDAVAYDNAAFVPTIFKPFGANILLLMSIISTLAYYYGAYYIQKNKLNLE